MNVRRREALGRNRRGPGTKNTMGTMVFLCVVIVGLAVFAFQYLTQPERVFGTRVLDCPAYEIQWEEHPAATKIRGCGKEVEAVCRKQCKYVDTSAAPEDSHIF